MSSPPHETDKWERVASECFQIASSDILREEQALQTEKDNVVKLKLEIQHLEAKIRKQEPILKRKRQDFDNIRTPEDKRRLLGRYLLDGFESGGPSRPVNRENDSIHSLPDIHDEGPLNEGTCLNGNAALANDNGSADNDEPDLSHASAPLLRSPRYSARAQLSNHKSPSQGDLTKPQGSEPESGPRWSGRCRRCFKHHQKCDKRKPRCKRCEAKGYDCVWPTMGEHAGGGSSGDTGASGEIEDTAKDIPALDGLSGASGLGANPVTNAKPSSTTQPPHPPSPRNRTISYDEVLKAVRDPDPKSKKHWIVEFPKESGKWYILRCVEHNRSFGDRPIRAAGKHIDSAAHEYGGRHHAWAVKLLGELVLGCNAELADQSNELYSQRLRSGYKPSSRGFEHGPRSRDQDPVATGPSLARIRSGEEELDVRSHERSPPKAFQGITHPKYGEVYQACYMQESGAWAWYLVAVLPRDSWHHLGISARLPTTQLARREGKKRTLVPSCYEHHEARGKLKRTCPGSVKIRGWAPGYEDGGACVKDRKFPVLFLEQELQIPQYWHVPFELPPTEVLAWVKAKHLRPRNFQHKDSENTEALQKSMQVAKQFEARVKEYVANAGSEDDWEDDSEDDSGDENITVDASFRGIRQNTDPSQSTSVIKAKKPVAMRISEGTCAQSSRGPSIGNPYANGVESTSDRHSSVPNSEGLNRGTRNSPVSGTSSRLNSIVDDDQGYDARPADVSHALTARCSTASKTPGPMEDTVDGPSVSSDQGSLATEVSGMSTEPAWKQQGGRAFMSHHGNTVSASSSSTTAANSSSLAHTAATALHNVDHRSRASPIAVVKRELDGVASMSSISSRARFFPGASVEDPFIIDDEDGHIVPGFKTEPNVENL